MDIAAHALWTMATAIAARRVSRHPVHLAWAAAWGILPDVVAFTVPASVRVFRFLTGASKSILPDGSEPKFEWVWGLYGGTHSAVIFALAFAAVWLVLRRPWFEMLGWALHICMDVPTHAGIFAIQVLWPLSHAHVNGLRWETPWLLSANYIALAATYAALWRTHRSHAGPCDCPGGPPAHKSPS